MRWLLMLVILFSLNSEAQLKKSDQYAFVSLGVGYIDSNPELFSDLKSEYGLQKAQPKEYNTYSFKAGTQFSSGWRVGATCEFYNTMAQWLLTAKKMTLSQSYGGLLFGRRFYKGDFIHGGVDVGLGFGQAEVSFFGEDLKGWTREQFFYIEPGIYVDIPFVFLEGAITIQVSYRGAFGSARFDNGQDIGQGHLVDGAPVMMVYLTIGNFVDHSFRNEEVEMQ